MDLPDGTKLRLEPADEYPHPTEEAKNYNESVYLNLFDPVHRMGGWFRVGNRPNEGHAEVSRCVYLPDGSVGFLYSRPQISNNDAFAAAGLELAILEPFHRVRLTYDGKLCLLQKPHQMADPRRAFENNPMVDCSIELDCFGVAPMYGGERVRADGSRIEVAAERSFARGHYEQHIGGRGAIRVGDREWKIDGLGLRDHSWGPRYWQAIRSYRWLPMSFDRDFAMMVSIVAGENGEPHVGGMVLYHGAYAPIVRASIDTDWDDSYYQTAMRIRAATDEREYEIEGTVRSLIPLRNRRTTPEGEVLHTRITEGMTEYRCDGKVGFGMSEYLDQIVDGRPVGGLD
jgi:hypothetical protein